MCWCGVNVTELSRPQIKARQYFHWSINQFFSPALQMVFHFRSFARVLKKKAGPDMYSLESNIFKWRIVRPSIHQFCCLCYVFFCSSTCWKHEYVFIPKDNTLICILNLFRYLTQVPFSPCDVLYSSLTISLAFWRCCDSVVLWRLFYKINRKTNGLNTK